MNLPRRIGMATAVALTLTCASCGSSSTTPQRAESVTTSSPEPPAEAPPATATSSTIESASAPTLTVDYTSAQGWHYSGQIPLPQYHVSFSVGTNSSPPGKARLVLSIEGPDGSPQELADDNPGRPDGPSLHMGFDLAYKLSSAAYKFSSESEGNEVGEHAIGELGSCSVTGEDSSENVTSARQEGYPFDLALICGPPEGQGSGPWESEGQVPEDHIRSLVNQLNGEQPWYVLRFNTADYASEPGGSSCIAFVTPSHIIKKVKPSMIPAGSNIPASSDCSKTTLSLSS